MARVTQNSKDFRQGTAQRLTLWPSGHFISDAIEEGNVPNHVGRNDGVADGIQGHLGTFLLDEKGVFHAFAFDGITQGAQKYARLDFAFDEVVLRTALQSLAGHDFVIQSGDDDDRHVRRGGTSAPHDRQSLGVRPQPRPELTWEDRVELTRGLTAEYATVKALLPRSRKALEFDSKGEYDKKQWTEIARVRRYRNGSVRLHGASGFVFIPVNYYRQPQELLAFIESKLNPAVT